MSEIDTTGIDRATLLAALYNRAQPQGMGFLHFTPQDMTRDEAEDLIAANTRQVYRSDRQECYFDYLKGRVMKIDVLPDVLNASMYDRDNGYGAADAVVAALRVSA